MPLPLTEPSFPPRFRHCYNQSGMAFSSVLDLLLALTAPSRAGEAPAVPTSASAPAKAEVKASTAAAKPGAVPGMKKFVAHVLEEGMSESLPSALVAAYELPEGLDGRILQVTPQETTDGLLHAFNALVLEEEPSKVQRLILLARKQAGDGRNTEFHAFICAPDGTLIRVVRSAWKNDPEGQAMGASASHRPLSAASPAVKALFRHELDFWLKGRFRKKQE